jgi:hypothetical protein
VDGGTVPDSEEGAGDEQTWYAHVVFLLIWAGRFGCADG